VQTFANNDFRYWNAIAITGDTSSDGKWQFWFGGLKEGDRHEDLNLTFSACRHVKYAAFYVIVTLNIYALSIKQILKTDIYVKYH